MKDVLIKSERTVVNNNFKSSAQIQLTQFDVKLYEAQKHIMPMIRNKQEKINEEKQFRMEDKKKPIRMLVNMTKKINLSKFQKFTKDRAPALCLDLGPDNNLATESRLKTFTNLSNKITTEATHSTYLNTESKIKQIETIKTRNKRISEKTTIYKEKAQNNEIDDIIIKNKINRIKDNFLVTNFATKTLSDFGGINKGFNITQSKRFNLK